MATRGTPPGDVRAKNRRAGKSLPDSLRDTRAGPGHRADRRNQPSGYQRGHQTPSLFPKQVPRGNFTHLDLSRKGVQGSARKKDRIEQHVENCHDDRGQEQRTRNHPLRLSDFADDVRRSIPSGIGVKNKHQGDREWAAKDQPEISLHAERNSREPPRRNPRR